MWHFKINKLGFILYHWLCTLCAPLVFNICNPANYSGMDNDYTKDTQRLNG